jgi:hypothetical protein
MVVSPSSSVSKVDPMVMVWGPLPEMLNPMVDGCPSASACASAARKVHVPTPMRQLARSVELS